MHDHALRRDKLRQALPETGADALLVTNEVNVRYLTGFTGDSSYLLLTPGGAVMLSDTRYEQQLSDECADLECEIRSAPATMTSLVASAVAASGAGSLAFESTTMSVATHAALQRALSVPLISSCGLVERLREIKDASEIEEIEASIAVAERVMAALIPTLRAAQTEREVAAELEFQIRRAGGEGCAFPPIIAAGPHAALPHAHPTSSRIDRGGLLLLDWGAVWQGYRSDLTRVLATDRITPELKAVYGVVLQAQAAAVEAVGVGVSLGQVDAAARELIADAGYGERFGHGLGHGFGLEIHESPRLAPRQEAELKAGMVITIEPGIYLPGWGGVRIEDDVLVTEEGPRVLTSFPKDLEQSLIQLS